MSDENPQGDPEALGDAGKAALAAERKRANDAEKQAREAQARIKELEEKDATEIEKATRRIAELESANQTLTTDLQTRDRTILRLNTGIDEGLPKNLILRLQGDDEEALKADAASLRELIPDNTPSPFPKADPSQGPKGAGKTSNADLFASAMDQAGL
jgi:TolA-binding protein